MAGYIDWIAPQYDTLLPEIRAQVERFRSVFLPDCVHPRTATIAAELLAGLEVFLDFALEKQAITEDEFKGLWERFHEAIRRLIGEHNRDLVYDDPVDQYIDLLRTALHSGAAHVVSVIGGPPAQFPTVWGWEKRSYLVKREQHKSAETSQNEEKAELQRQEEDEEAGVDYDVDTKVVPRGSAIGWLSWNDLYIQPKASLAVVQGLARRIANPLPLTERTLGKRLHAKGLLVSRDENRGNRYTKRVPVDGTRVNALHLKADTVNPHPSHTADFLDEDYDGPPPEDLLEA